MDTSTLDPIVKFMVENFYPFVTSLLIIVGACRTIFKPATDLVLAIVSVTKTKKDDEFVTAVSTNKFYKAFIWLVNYLLSIKLPK